MEDFTVEDHPGMHRYASPQGLPLLLEALAEDFASRTGLATSPRQVLVAAGATGALGAVVSTLAEAGDEVLLLAPYWPLIAGIVRSAGAAPIDVPFFDAVSSASEATALLDRHRTAKTVAVYLNTPNNPTGRVIPPDWLDAIVAWAQEHDLWIFADEVYEHYVYDGEHTYTRPLAPERTFSVHSFSKAYGMAGNRCGHVIGPKAVLSQVRKISTHTFYSTPTASQLAAIAALTDGRGDAWVADAKKRYAELGRATADRLGLPRPEGSTFVFLDVAEHLDERGLMGFLEDAVEQGLFVAPGPSFGPYPTHVRVCFTSAAPELVERGVEVLARMIGR